VLKVIPVTTDATKVVESPFCCDTPRIRRPVSREMAAASEDLDSPLSSLRRVVEHVFPGRLDADEGEREKQEDSFAVNIDDDDVAESSGSEDDSGNEAGNEDEVAMPTPESVIAAAGAAAAAATGPSPPVSKWELSGEGLTAAQAGRPATFHIEGVDAGGVRRRNVGGDKFVVTLNGAATVRARVWDDGDGRYTCEYKCSTTGKYRLSVMRAGQHLAGSPYHVVCKTGEAKASLKDWKAGRLREADELRRSRKLKQQGKKQLQQERIERRAPSPRINPREQLNKAFELALAAVRADGGREPKHRPSSRSSASKAASLKALNQDLMAV
jgi:hypothetical protein